MGAKVNALAKGKNATGTSSKMAVADLNAIAALRVVSCVTCQSKNCVN